MTSLSFGLQLVSDTCNEQVSGK